MLISFYHCTVFNGRGHGEAMAALSISGAARKRRTIGRPMSRAHPKNLVGSPTTDELTQTFVCFPTAGERYRHSPSVGERYRR